MSTRAHTIRNLLICGAILMGLSRWLPTDSKVEFVGTEQRLTWQADELSVDGVAGAVTDRIAGNSGVAAAASSSPVPTAALPDPLVVTPPPEMVTVSENDFGRQTGATIRSLPDISMDEESGNGAEAPVAESGPGFRPGADAAPEHIDQGEVLTIGANRGSLDVLPAADPEMQIPVENPLPPAKAAYSAISGSAADLRQSAFQPVATQTVASGGPSPAPASSTFQVPAPDRLESASPAPAASTVVEQRALEHLEYGRSLARRGATFASREELVQSLRLITESYDVHSGTRQYTNMLAAGLRALGEADDFVMIDAEQQLNIDMAGIVAMHESKIITEAEASMLTPIAAMQKYFQYATEQISAAAGNSVVAADALYAMGKLLQTSSSEDPAGKPIDRAKAMVMFQAALAANAEDYRSANELGVLMAHNGRWEMARDLFAQSLKIHKTAEAWLNIAEAHEQLGESGYAEQARVEYRQLVTAGHPDSNVEWVSAQQFASKGVLPVEPEAVEVPRTAAKPEDSVRPKGNRLLEGIKKWF